MSEVFEKIVAELNLDRNDWQLVKFGDIAIQQKQTVDRENTELTRYVKGEHMYSEDIHLREWGELKDEYLGPAFIRKFEEGDILYGSRRTYLRKVVIAPFKGITSNTTFVIKANEEKIDKRLLPFIMLSEGFSQHSIKNSKGSVNPYVNWKDIAGYEFLLPSLTLQNKLSELLSDLEVLKETEICLRNKLQTTYEAFIKENCLNNKGSSTKLSEIIERLDSGVSVNSEEGEITAEDKGILKTSAVSYGFFDPNEYKKVRADELTRLKGKVEKNTIIISRMNTYELVGANAYVEDIHDNLYLPDRLWQTHISRKDINVKFLWLILSSKQYRAKISMLSSGTSNSMKNISKESFLSLKVYLPNKPYQDKIVGQVEQIEKSKTDLSKKLEYLIKLNKSIINQVF
ncbi:restriction endonuclease subunit S [Psychrobacter sp. 1Y1]|uniref:restriction endonuclease subunit S n=1 Tax=Psychrobacter sp. 1Y1 TaxID=3453574 RepID=UPI003F469BBA|tara:strand:- start:634 stop:1836 length:1203 start_codon:yes stop_codon:yes gene_type:complete